MHLTECSVRGLNRLLGPSRTVRSAQLKALQSRGPVSFVFVIPGLPEGPAPSQVLNACLLGEPPQITCSLVQRKEASTFRLSHKTPPKSRPAGSCFLCFDFTCAFGNVFSMCQRPWAWLYKLLYQPCLTRAPRWRQTFLHGGPGDPCGVGGRGTLRHPTDVVHRRTRLGLSVDSNRGHVGGHSCRGAWQWPWGKRLCGLWHAGRPWLVLQTALGGCLPSRRGHWAWQLALFQPQPVASALVASSNNGPHEEEEKVTF